MKTAFSNCTDDYAAGRPGYPPKLPHIVAEKLDLALGAVVADVGAGTGIATKLFRDAGFGVIPIEPDERMRAEGSRLIGVEFRDGTAEATGLAGASVDAVIAAQAFHWFDPAHALAEWQRILCGGGLALFWNSRDAARSPLVAEFDALIHRYNPRHDPAYRYARNWGEVLSAAGLFQPATMTELRHEVEFTAERLVRMARSISYVRGALTEEQMAAFERDLRAIVARHCGERPFVIPYLVNLWTARVR